MENDFQVKEFDEVMDFMREDDDLINPSEHQFLDSGNEMNALNFDFSTTLRDSAEIDHSLKLEEENKNRKPNLRKSLAWDSAFFTSAGVLDAEELSSMIRGSEISVRKVLPGILEDDLRSSVSTLDSDTLTLESLEAELFQDIRASIQKSSSVMPSRNVPGSQGVTSVSIPSLTKPDHSSERKEKLEVKNNPRMLLKGATESVKKRNPSHLEVAQGNCDVKCKNTSLSRPMPPRGPLKLSSVPPSQAKRYSASSDHTFKEKDVTQRPINAARGAPLAKLSTSSKPAIPRPIVTSKVSVSVPLKDTKKGRSIVRPSTENSSSVLSSNSEKIPMVALKKGVPLKPTKLPASSSTSGVPLRIKSKESNPPAIRTKVQPTKSRLSENVNHTQSNISSISPASSSEFSFESSSSSSTVNQRSNSQKAYAEAASISMSGAKGGDDPLALDTDVHSTHFSMGSELNTVTSLQTNFTGEHTTVSSFPHLATARPSGLRMPSPKNGFFDGGIPKKAVHVERHMSNGMAKGENICSPTGGSSNAKSRKNQPQTRMSSQTKDAAQPVALSMKPVSHIPGRKLPNNMTIKPSSFEASIHDHTSPLKLETSVSPKTSRKHHMNPAEISTELNEGKSDDGFCSSHNVKVGDVSAGGMKVSLKDSSEINCEGLDLKRDPVISCGTRDDGKRACDSDKTEHSSIMNSDTCSQSRPVTPSVTEGPEI